MAGSLRSLPTAANARFPRQAISRNSRRRRHPHPRVAMLYARAIRSAARMTQSEFAARIGVPVETVRNWEQGKRSPRGPARALLRMIEGAPDVAFSILSKKH